MKNKKIYFHLFNGLLCTLAAMFIGQSFIVRRVSAGWDTGLAIPAVIGFVMLIIVIARLVKKNRLIEKTSIKRVIMIIASIGLLSFLFIGTLLMVDPLIHGPDHFPEQERNWIVILGCGIKADGTPTWALQNRLDSALLWGKKYSNTEYVVTGGQGHNEPISEGLSMARYLEVRGVNSNVITIEDQSTSTLENFTFSKRAMEEKGWNNEPILLVTNDFHVFRSRILASRCGFTAYAIPAETPAVIRTHSYLREILALMKSLIFDWPNTSGA